MRIPPFASALGSTKHSLFLLLLVIGTFGGVIAAKSAKPAGMKPNILAILADDVGGGDDQGDNPRGKIASPTMDRLVPEGMRFIHAYTAMHHPSRGPD